MFNNNFTDSFLRVEEYNKSGKDKNIIDPDPNGLYTKRKEQRNRASSSEADSSRSDWNNKDLPSIKYPTDGWSTSLEKMPMFTRAEMNEHIQ